MASEGNSGGRVALQIFLGLVILALAAALIYVIVAPAQRVAREEAEREAIRERMDDVRVALIAYRDSTDVYPGTLDSLVGWVTSDSGLVGVNLDSLFQTSEGSSFTADSLPFSPVSGRRLNYERIEDDSTNVDIYWLGSPDYPADSIGSHFPDATMRNAASWE